MMCISAKSVKVDTNPHCLRILLRNGLRKRGIMKSRDDLRKIIVIKMNGKYINTV